MLLTLSDQEVNQFITDGYVRINQAFTSETAEEALTILWNDLPVERFNPETWQEPVIRLGMYSQPPFIESVNSARLHAVFDQLVGPGKWQPCRNVGTFPVRFPSLTEPNDTGPHVDASFPGEDPNDYLKWRINVKSRGRALLLLVLYSDVSETDAPTIIFKKSHLDVAKLLHPEGEHGLTFMELAVKVNNLPPRDLVSATGKAGTIYLCHPFIVHAAQAHRGKTPKFMAQPPLLLRHELNLTDPTIGYTPLEESIRLGIAL